MLNPLREICNDRNHGSKSALSLRKARSQVTLGGNNFSKRFVQSPKTLGQIFCRGKLNMSAIWIQRMSSAFIKLGYPKSGATGWHRVSKQLKALWQQSSGVPWHRAGDSWETKSVCLARIRVFQISPCGQEVRLNLGWEALSSVTVALPKWSKFIPNERVSRKHGVWKAFPGRSATSFCLWK